jgi:hypothetical protein
VSLDTPLYQQRRGIEIVGCYSKFLALKKKKKKRKHWLKKKDERGNKKVGIAEISQLPATSFSLFLP